MKFARGNWISLSHYSCFKPLSMSCSGPSRVFDLYSGPYPSHGGDHCGSRHVWVRVCTTIGSCMALRSIPSLHISPPIYVKVGSMHSAYSAIKSYYYIYKMTTSSCLGQRDGSEQGRQGISIRPRRETNINVHEGAVYMRYSA